MVPDAPLLQLTDATVVRSGRTILHVPSFVLAEGATVALLGPNGAGKSTFVGLLTRDVQPLWRERPPVLWRGRKLVELSETRRLTGIVSSSMQDAIDVHLSVREVVVGGRFGTLGLPVNVRSKVTAEDEAAAVRVLDEVGAGHLTERDMRTLSTGEARRVLIARALVHSPAVLVLDEPCAGLDPTAAWHVRGLMRELAESGRTILLVTHHIEDVVRPIERVVLLNDGAVVADGVKQDVLTSSALSKLFAVDLELEARDGEYRLW